MVGFGRVIKPSAWLHASLRRTLTTNPHHHPTGPHGRLLWLVMAASGGVAAHLVLARYPGSLDSASAAAMEDVPEEGQAVDPMRLKEWLRAQGMHLDLVEVKPSQAAPGAGLGLFTSEHATRRQLRQCMASASSGGRRWWWPFGLGPRDAQRPLATFPLSAAITAGNILREPSLGGGYAWMLEHGLVDQRTVIMAYLLVERLKGEASGIAPWIDALPKTFDTPIMFTAAELEELKGTPLYRAQAIVRSRLQELWGRMQPALASLLAGQPGVQRPATFEDLLWAYSVFWSRGQSLPVPARPGAASRLLAADPLADAHALLEVQEGIVPGLDFCNHHPSAPKCWWEVVVPPSTSLSPQQRQQRAAAATGVGPGPQADAGPAPCKAVPGPVVQLRLHAGAHVQPGEELMISYGEKSNEELLMLYGFAVAGNPHDHIMLHCPLPPAKAWDDVMHARMALVNALRYELQFFLPSIPAPSPSGRGSSSGNANGASSAASSSVPSGLLDTLEVFVMTPREVSSCIQAIKDGEEAAALSPVDVKAWKQRRSTMGTEEAAAASHRLGLRMGACATLVKMLESRVEEQEGDQGTGPLEQDQLLLQQEASVRDMDRAQLRRHACIIYRAEQKRITREYLRLARGELQEILSLMQELDDSMKPGSSVLLKPA